MSAFLFFPRTGRIILQFVFLAVFLLGFLQCNAQSGGKEDVVYTKNGWVIRGKILELDTQGSVKIQTVGGNIFTFKMEEVERITQESPLSPGTSRAHRDLHQKKRFSYFNASEFGLLVGSQPFFSCKTLNGVFFDQRLWAGIGIGYQKMTWDLRFTPIYFQVRSELLKNRPVSPLAYLSTGYNAGWINKDPWVGKVRGGILTECGLGLKFNTTYELGYTLLLNYQYSKATQTQDFGNGFIRTQEINFNRIGLMLGVTF